MHSEIFPLLPVATGMILAIFTFCAPTMTDLGGWRMVFSAGALAVLSLAFDWPSRRRFAVGLALGAILAGWHLWRPWQTYRRSVGGGAAGRIVAVVVDPFADPGPWGAAGGRRRVVARLRRMHVIGEDESRRVRGKIILVMPVDRDVDYGDVMAANGFFEQPAKPAVDGQFNYRRYLQTMGVHHLFVAQTVDRLEASSPSRTVTGGPFALRGWLVEQLIAGVKDENHARAAAAMVLGYRRTLDPATRRLYLRSGALHLFAISGLHVGIAMAVALFALRLCAVPYTLRYWVLPIVLGGYVYLTGASPSAVRAWTMIVAVSLACTTLRPHSPVNGISLAAIVLLGWNPLSLFNIGFQFSFVIVVTLILGWRLVGAATEVCTEKNRWTVGEPAWRHALRRMTIGGGRLLAHGGLAWLGGAGLVAWNNGLIIPAALWLNLAVVFLAFLALTFAVAKLMVACLGLSLLSVLLAKPLELSLALIRMLVELAEASSGCIAIAKPWGGFIVLYYLILLVFLAPQSSRRWRLTALAALAGVFALVWTLGVVRRPEAVILAHGDGAGHLACIVERPPAPPLAIFSGNYAVDMTTLDLLRLRGHDTLGVALLPATGGWAGQNLERVLAQIDVERVVLPPGVPFDWQTLHTGRDRPKPQTTRLETDGDVVAGDFPPPDWAIHRFSLREMEATVYHAEGRKLALAFSRVAHASHRVEIDGQTGPPFDILLPASLRVQTRVVKPHEAPAGIPAR